MANPRVSDMVRSLLTGRAAGKRAFFAFARESREELLALKDMIEAGQIAPVVDRVFAMDEAAEAHRHVEQELRLGPAVISLDTGR